MSRRGSLRKSTTSESLIHYANMDDTFNVKSMLYENSNINLLDIVN